MTSILQPLATTSANGTPVVRELLSTADADTQTWHLQYGKGGRGRECWYPAHSNSHTINVLIDEVTRLFLADCDNLGRPFRTELAQRMRAARRNPNHLAEWRARQTRP